MGPGEGAVDALGSAAGGEVEATGGSYAELGAEIAGGGVELGEEGGGGAEADVRFLLGVVIEGRDEDVFVAAGLAGLGIGAAEDIGSFGRFGGFGGRRLRWGGLSVLVLRMQGLGEERTECELDDYGYVTMLSSRLTSRLPSQPRYRFGTRALG